MIARIWGSDQTMEAFLEESKNFINNFWKNPDLINEV